MLNLKHIAILLFSMVATLAAMATTLPSRPQPARLMNDMAGIAKNPQALEDTLQMFAKKSGVQIIVATLSDTLTESVENTAKDLAQAWKLEGKSGENTLLIVTGINKTENKPFTSVVPGDNLKDKFPYMTTRHIASDQITGPYKDGKTYDEALLNGLDYFKRIISGDLTCDQYKSQQAGYGWLYFIAAGIILILIAIFFPRRSKN